MRILGFDELEAMDFVSAHRSGFARLLALRDIEGASIFGDRFLERQAEALAQPGLDRLLARLSAHERSGQPEPSAFTPVNGSTGWMVIYVGYLGLNGTFIPAVERAVAHLFREHFDADQGLFLSTGRQYPGFAPCDSAMLLRALLRLGFGDDDRVLAACERHLEAIHGTKGTCRQKRGGYPCAWGMAKNLLLLNAFPEDLRAPIYRETVEEIQTYLLSRHLAEGDFPRGRNSFIDHPRHWTSLGYFRSYQSDRFEACEALVDSGVKDHPDLQRTLNTIGRKCIRGVTWQPDYHRGDWPLDLEVNGGSPFLTLRGLRIARAA